MAKEKERRSLELAPDEWQALEGMAEIFGTCPPSGPTAGQPSWRSLIKEIARGAVVIVRPQPAGPQEV
jgi:hypothetical protein